MAKKGQPAKTAKGPVPKRKADSSLSPEQDRYGHIYTYARDHGKGPDWARTQINKITKSKGDLYLSPQGVLVSKKAEDKKALKARKNANKMIERERLLNEISDITEGEHMDIYNKINSNSALEAKLAEWKKKDEILDSIRSEQGDEVAEALIKSNPVMSKWETAENVALNGATTPEEKSLYQQGYDELNARSQAGIVNEGTDFSEAERIHYTQGDYTRKEFRDRFVIPGNKARNFYGWQEDLASEIKHLVNNGLIDPGEANKYLQEWGHRGSVAIPGYASRANYESNVNSESRLYNSSTGHGMTIPEVHNTDIHMSSGEGYTLSEKSKQHLDELIERFPNSAVAKKAQAVLDNVPMSDIIDIGDPNRDAKFGGDTRDNLLLFSNSKASSPGSLSRNLTHDDARSAIHYERSLKNFDFNTQNAAIRLPKGVTQGDIDRIKNSPDPINQAYFDAVGKRLEENAKLNRVESASDTLQASIKMLPEDVRKQIGSANLKSMAALTVLATAGLGGAAGVAKFTGMSEEEKSKMYQGIVDKAMSGLNAYGKVVDSGYEAFEAIPGYNAATGFYDNAVDWLNNISNKGGVSKSGGYYGEDGSWVAGQTFNNTYGAGDAIDTGIQTVNPADELAAFTGLLKNIWYNEPALEENDGGGGW